MADEFDAVGFVAYVDRRLREFAKGEHVSKPPDEAMKPSEPHKVSEPMNELEYYREVQRLGAENAVLKDTLRHMAQSVHQAYHTDRPEGWHDCPKNVCVSAQQQLPDYVAWLRGGGPKP